MGFRENWRQKMSIDELAAQVVRSMGAPDSSRRLDLEAMGRLVAMGPYTHRRERDLDLYLMEAEEGRPRILVLDNELKIYATGIDDVALRKSPTIKEMVSIRNAIKILNDKDVVVSRKADTVRRVQQELIAALDLTYTEADVEALAEDGRNTLANQYLDGLLETLSLFAELLGYEKAPKAFRATHHRIWGRVKRRSDGLLEMGPCVLLDLMATKLKLLHGPFNSRNPADMARMRQVIEGAMEPDQHGAAVFSALKDAVMAGER